MSKIAFIVLSIFLLIFSSCNKTVEKTVYISSDTKPCKSGEMQTECLQVKWKNDQKDWEFVDNIDGFSHEKGFEYELLIMEEKLDNPPADASFIKYSLVKVISKKKVETESANLAHNSKNSLDWTGTYNGILPCADCEGIKTTVTLENDNIYILTEEYLGKDGKPYVTKGSFSWNKEGNQITLINGERNQRYKVGENMLIHLDMNGKQIEGKLAEMYTLNKK